MHQSFDRVRVRFAPSPTGYLHVGGARTALYNYLFAKKMQGDFILRVEDTDQVRSTDESLKMVIEDLQWLGLNWDEGPEADSLIDKGKQGPYRQSQRLPIYQKYAQQLLACGQAYYCFLTDQELEAQKEQLTHSGANTHVESPYRNWSLEQALKEQQAGKKAVIRFKNSVEIKDYVFNDLIRGEIKFPSDMVGDFVLLRSDGMPVYNFCNVVDDHLMKISHVLRAEEHLPNTLRQLMLYEAFAWPVPEFGHMSLILDEDRKKLSKRSGATSCHEFKLEGYLPQALNNFIALLGWSHPEGKEIITMEEIITHFSLDRLNPAGAIFDPIKLKWMNGQYLKTLTDSELLNQIKPFLNAENIQLTLSDEQQQQAVGALRSYFETLQEGAKVFQQLDDRFFEIHPESQEILQWEITRTLIAAWIKQIEQMDKDFMSEAEFTALQDQLKTSLAVKGKQLFMPLRVAVIGKPHGPELKLVVPLLSKKQLLHRASTVISKQ